VDNRTQNGQVSRSCYLSQAIKLKSTNKTVFELVINPPKAGKVAVAAAIGPLGALLANGIGVNVTGMEPQKLAFRSCNGNGCYALFNFDAKFVRTFRAGDRAEFAIFDEQSGKPFVIPMSLAGFSAAHARLLQTGSKN